MEQQTITTKGKSTPMELARLKSAAEEYKVHKSIFIDPVTEEQLVGFQPWPVFRDEFLADWKSNRRIVTEKEADVHFDRIADESLSELEQIGAPTDVNALVDQVAQTEIDEDDSISITPVATPVAEASAAAPKRRGRPPGSGKLKVVASNDAVPAVAKRRGRPPGSGKKAAVASKPSRKVAAKKKGGNTSAKAQAIVERYVARKWSRKDVIEKLVSQIDGLGVAYASTLYQKFA